MGSFLAGGEAFGFHSRSDGGGEYVSILVADFLPEELDLSSTEGCTKINSRLNVVEELMSHSEIMSVTAQYLRKLPDLERLLGRVKASFQSSASLVLPLIGIKVLKQRVKAFGSLIKGLRIGMDLLILLQNEKQMMILLSKVVKFPVLSGNDGLDKFLAQFEAAIESDFPNYQNGMACALETLCGQAYGAQQYSKLRTQTYTAIFSLLIVCLPLSVIWIFMRKILLFFGQDPLISQEAGKFTMFLIPAIFAYAILQPLVRYFQMQSLMFPVVMSSFFAFALHIPLCWFLVFHTKLKNLGGALAIDISIWLNVTFLILYMKYSSVCAKTRVPISFDVLRGVGEFFSFAISSALMICLEWWPFEIMILLSGLLPNPKLETSVLSVCLNTMATMYAMPLGLGAAVSTRVSNELGAGNPQGARNSVYVVMSIAAVETSIVSAILFTCRGVFGYVFTNEKTVVGYVTAMAPLVCLSLMMDGIQGVLTGVARGCGWQHLGAYVNFGAFNFWGIPIGVFLAFWFELRVKGLWIGIQSGILYRRLHSQ